MASTALRRLISQACQTTVSDPPLTSFGQQPTTPHPRMARRTTRNHTILGLANILCRLGRWPASLGAAAGSSPCWPHCSPVLAWNETASPQRPSASRLLAPSQGTDQPPPAARSATGPEGRPGTTGQQPLMADDHPFDANPVRFSQRIAHRPAMQPVESPRLGTGGSRASGRSFAI